MAYFMATNIDIGTTNTDIGTTNIDIGTRCRQVIWKKEERQKEKRRAEMQCDGCSR